MLHQPGEIIGDKYRIECLLGIGAFGEVYLVTHLKLNAPRALKVLSRSKSGVGSTQYDACFDRFSLEAQLGARLDTPFVVRVYDFEEIDDELVLVMEYALGGSLVERINKLKKAGKVMSVPNAVQVGLEVAEGLAAIHALDIVHRDLKPGNILFDAEGRAKVADLGLAQVPGGGSIRSQLGSLAGTHPGTPAYMSPEQESSPSYLRPASDVYSLGIILFELLAGRNYKNLEPGARVKPLRGEVPEWLDELLARMLADETLQRPWDGEKVAVLLHNALTVTIASPMPVLGIGSTQTSLKDGMPMVYVPAGNFRMGSDKMVDTQARDDELPQHIVNLDAFWIDKTPVTNAMFTRFVAAASYQTDAEKAGWGWVINLSSVKWEQIFGADWQHPLGPNSSLRGLTNHPVVQVSWNDAQAYCAWAGRRLPTEAEWEKAARGTDGRIYPWGNQPQTDNLVNFANNNLAASWVDKNMHNSYQFAKLVGSYSAGASPYGALDMASNVWEWTGDWYSEIYYQRSPSSNPAGPSSGEYRVLRGGSWRFDVRLVRSAYRGWLTPGNRFYFVGFRCATSL